jgi:hypothetical protein
VNVSGMGGYLNLITGGVGQSVHQKLIDTQQFLTLIGHKAVVFVKFFLLVLLIDEVVFRAH